MINEAPAAPGRPKNARVKRVKFGKYLIDSDKLHMGLLSLCYDTPSFSRIKDLPIQPLSSVLRDCFRYLLDTQHNGVPPTLLEQLDDTEKEELGYLLHRAGLIEHMPAQRTRGDETSAQLRRFKILSGSLLQGNTSADLWEELVQLMRILKRKGKLPYRRYEEIMAMRDELLQELHDEHVSAQ